MSKIIYPFAAIPNQVLRGGHGPVNVAVLAVLMSHGRSTASAKTLADEVGCDRKSIFKAIAYWVDKGPAFGIFLRTSGGKTTGKATIIEIEITTCTENGTGAVEGCTENGTGGVPKTEHLPVPKTVHKEEPIKKNPEEDGRTCGNVDKTKRPFIEGDPAFFDEIRKVWRVKTHNGVWLDYVGDVKKNLVYK
ncbi:MAG: hypothetical protein PHC53_02540 [Patescibacteria group bacterium]|nr:hypothetical protein [Patescibacteria group bacterium]